MQNRHSQHISREFNDELETIRSQVLRMGGLLETQLDKAIRAMLDNDQALAAEVKRGDAGINRMEMEIDAACIDVVARRQPAASDLRFIIGVFKTIADLERMGDESKRVAKMSAAERASVLPVEINAELRHMGELVQGMLHDVLDAFARLDDQAALAVARQDERVDAKYKLITTEAMRFMAEDPASVQAAMSLMWAARALERIGDRSQNIAEHVIYLVHGRDVRHLPLDDLFNPQ
ncbi:MAG: phosphate signaling complex protein PhoU [Gammaproteobacteria bacterium]|nr:phosphate signaling complex protein PhoU [Gammaproteobacteria bacterium]